MTRLCVCGRIVERDCPACGNRSKRRNQGTTKERGYGNDWRVFSERYRQQNPLCEVCNMRGVVPTRAAAAVHHIVKIADNRALRLDPSNCLAVCRACHDEVENNESLAREAKSYSDSHK